MHRRRFTGRRPTGTISPSGFHAIVNSQPPADPAQECGFQPGSRPMNKTFDFQYEKPQDISDIRKVHESAFETRTEADLVDVLRDKNAHVISIVAIMGTRIVGHILFSPVTLETDGVAVKLLGLAPMAVVPEYQRKGIGSKLVEKGLAESRAKRYPAVVILGHPGYYPIFGFTPSVNYSITSEYDVPPDVFMIKELAPGVLAGIPGIAKYHEAFTEL